MRFIYSKYICQDFLHMGNGLSPFILIWSFATHFLEGGTDISYIQELLGHASSKTTEVYTHVAEKSITNIQSLLDGVFIAEVYPKRYNINI